MFTVEVYHKKKLRFCVFLGDVPPFLGSNHRTSEDERNAKSCLKQFYDLTILSFGDWDF